MFHVAGLLDGVFYSVGLVVGEFSGNWVLEVDTWLM